MSCGFDPDDRRDFVLPADANLPEDERPTFELRHLTRRQWGPFEKNWRRADRLRATSAADVYLVAALRIALAGWRNVTTIDPKIAALFGLPMIDGRADLPFNIDLIGDLLTLDELWAIADAVPAGIFPTDSQRKSVKLAVFRRFRFKNLCKGCKQGQCVDVPQPMSPFAYGGMCDVCEGKRVGDATCPGCGGWGFNALMCCPLDVIEDYAWDAIEAADHAKDRMWPVAGGYLDQTVYTVQAVQLVRSAEAKARED